MSDMDGKTFSKCCKDSGLIDKKVCLYLITELLLVAKAECLVGSGHRSTQPTSIWSSPRYAIISVNGDPWWAQ